MSGAETQTMTLVDFLLTRIAEDEAVARKSIEDDQRMTAQAGPIEEPEPAYITEQAKIGLEYVVGVRPARVLAECEVKRRIVAGATVSIPANSDWGAGYNKGIAHHHSDVLRALALPYADRPDYRQEWRP